MGRVLLHLFCFSLTNFVFHRPGVADILDVADNRAALLESTRLRASLDRGTAIARATPNLLTPDVRKRGATMSSIQTKLPKESAIKSSAQGSINGGLKLETYKALVAELEEALRALDKTTKDFADQTSLNASLNASVASKDTVIGSLTERSNQNQNAIREHEKTIRDQASQIKKLTDEKNHLDAALADAIASLKDAGKHSAMEQNEAVNKCIQDYMFRFSFRTWKFARGDQLETLTKDIYVGLSGMINIHDATKTDSFIPEDEFCRIYTSKVTSELNRRRQYVQTRLIDAMLSKSNMSVCQATFSCVPDGMDDSMLWHASFGAYAGNKPLHAVVDGIRNTAKGNLTLNEAVLLLIDWTYSNFFVFSASSLLRGPEKAA